MKERVTDIRKPEEILLGCSITTLWQLRKPETKNPPPINII